MSTVSDIESTERTWNPIVGCTKVSQGCKHCYAEVMARRLRAMGVSEYQQPFTTVRELPQRLDEPLRIKKPTLWFVNSMSDLFQDGASDAFIGKVFDTMARADWHRFQVLTKRAERMADFFKHHAPPPPNVWLGVSVENKKQGLPRIAKLRTVKARTRFLSIEPLLEDLGTVNLKSIDWVIVGGESGHRARGMKLEWALSIQRQCLTAGVPFFFKQWGTFGEDGIRRSKARNGRMLLNQVWDEMPVAATA
jgi:protein gp37